MMSGPGAMANHKPLQKLSPEQQAASVPVEDVWLTASAGTGKTQVLSARVLRLLLSGARPESILCLTFTKAGATEMAERVHNRLATWVRAADKNIRADLFHLGEANTDAQIERARTLFAKVLDARGGGLRIQTIHSFCQTLLSGFPAEAGLTPGFRPMEERESTQLAQTVLAELVSTAIAQGENGFVERFEALALAKGEEGTRAYLMACVRAHRELAAMGSGVAAQVRVALGLPVADIAPVVEAGCADGGFDRDLLTQIAAANAAWGTATGLSRADIVSDWLSKRTEDRIEGLGALVTVWVKADGELRAVEKKLVAANPDYAALCAAAHAHFNGLIELRRLAEHARQIADALLVGQRFAAAFVEAKRRVGGVDFDDLIHITAALLRTRGMGEWVRYKLDQSTDHILVDEAQDTNEAQWDVIKALAGEFYAGDGPKSGAPRTIFTVGDTKQAIFGFQGTDPRAMATARHWFDAQARGVGRELRDLNLNQSYRSSPPILALVDALVEGLGVDAMGLETRATQHHAALGVAGHVTLWPPVKHDDGAGGGANAGRDEEGWVPPSNRLLARQIATQVATWLREGLWIEDRLAKKSRRLRARDVMILLRSRGELAQLIVARLHEAKVSVAGIDRLRLNTPLVVRDVIAAVRCALQPLDDLNLACLLVSPLFGWSQARLQEVAIARGRRALWPHLRATETPDDHAELYRLLTMGDRLKPSTFIEALLTGPIRGRYKLIERFGEEARDPLDELMNAALSFERTEVPALQGFLNWFEQGDIDIKRDADSDADAVRVLTVHGAKGLQAPLVILADAASDPQRKYDALLDWPVADVRVPIPRPVKADRMSSLADAADTQAARDMEEHWRLLYVALTRAEERLVVAGALGKQRALSDMSWHAAIGRALVTLGAEADDTGIMRYGLDAAPGVAERGTPKPAAAQIARLDWLDRPAPLEARPPRPLAPSAYTDDASPNPPPSPALQAAAARGRLLHALFERLPSVMPGTRQRAADEWLARAAGVVDASQRAGLIADALAVIEAPDFADLFSGDALAEAPIAGVVDGIVIAGTVDRLLVRERDVLVLDFKTARRAPQSVDAIPPTHLRQMAAYAAVLQTIFPQHRVRAILLYTSGPTVFTLDAAQLAAHKPSFQLEQQVLSSTA